MSKIILFVTLFCCSAFSAPIKHIDSLLFAVNTPGSPPYLYYNSDSQSYQGVVVDFFSQLERNKIPIITFLDSSRGRSEKFIIDGKADMMLSSRSWLENPDLISVSDKLLTHKSYLYSVSAFESDFTLQNKKKMRICTRRGFAYPGLQSYFENNQHFRADSSSQATMAMMLQKKRCDYAVMNNYNAAAIFANQLYCQTKIYQSPTPTNSVDIVFVMGSKMHKLKTLINQQIKVFSESEQLNEALLKHSSNPTFPLSFECTESILTKGS